MIEKPFQNDKMIFMETLRFANISLIHAKRYEKDSEWKINRVLNAAEIYMVNTGSFHLIMNEKHYIIDAKKMVFIPANVHREIYVEKNKKVDFFSLQFHFEAGGRAYSTYLSSADPVNTGEKYIELKELLSRMVKIGEPTTHSEVFERLGYCCMLISNFLEISNVKTVLPKQKSRIDFQRVMSYIDRFYRYKKITIKELADLLNVSEGYFRREFKKEYGISCKLYIDSMRMEGVLKMLRESNASVKDLAELFQYPDSAYLSKQVKIKTGLSPSDYRAKFR